MYRELRFRRTRYQVRYFSKDSLSPLLFVLALFKLSSILRKVEAAYEILGSKEKVNGLLFIDDLKL